jgi:transposase-like protein
MDDRHPIHPHSQLLRAVRRVRFSNHRGSCPRCLHPRFHRWGRFAGRQRYRCLGCKRTFSDLTGTPLHYSKRLGLWDRYVLCLLSSLSVRRAAAELGVDKNTAFRWRHLLLAAYRAREDPRLSGEVEVIRVRIPCIGSPAPGRWRPPRRGEVAGWQAFTAPRAIPDVVCGLLLYARSREEGWEIELGYLPRFEPLPQEDLFQELLPRLVPPVTLIGEVGTHLDLRPVALAAHAGLILGPRGGSGPVSAYGGRTGSTDRTDPGFGEGGDTSDSGSSTRRVWAYQRRLRFWIARFFGVSLRYVAHYFAWHRFLERSWGPSVFPGGEQETWTGDVPDPAGQAKRLARRFLLRTCAP